MERYKVIRLESVESTNSYAKEISAEMPHDVPVVIVADSQTAGRGQRGNTWESEPGANLTFSIVLFPKWMSPARQFELSMLVSVAIVNTLRKYVDRPEWLRIKWPNDIYYGDNKIAGILIENSLGESSIEKSVIGIGLNVNQKRFVSDAPNPMSLCGIVGHDIDCASLLSALVDNILDMVDQYADDPEIDELTALYNGLLWRNDGAFHKWMLPSGAVIEARIVAVGPDGLLDLCTPAGETQSFRFKEIAAVL